MIKRVFLIVMDSLGVGELDDANDFGDVGSNTLGACFSSDNLQIPTLTKLGICNIDGVSFGHKIKNPIGAFAKMIEKSKGKDTTIGHWEIAGIISDKPLPTYPDGFPERIINEFEKKTERKTICNLPYSGTKVLEDYGDIHMKTGDLIIYTSADSVFQIAAHEDIVPVDELYKYCEIAREMLVGDDLVGRVIARPFIHINGNFMRTTNRHDYSIKPPKSTILTALQNHNLTSIGIGKIYDIFDGLGVDNRIPTLNNTDGMSKTINLMKNDDFTGLCFVNLVDFDMLYGHRNDVEGYANALTEFDIQLNTLLTELKDDDLLILTADHGCDPITPSTDHSREYVPLLVYGKQINPCNLHIRDTFADISATILDIFNIKEDIAGSSFLKQIIK